ncbi:MAG: gliding motility-associated C-terminal domain-containing protein [Bacteroidota bacterium]
MKHLLLTIGLVISALQIAYSQSKDLTFDAALSSNFAPDSIISIQWLDMDNNDSLEIVTVIQHNNEAFSTIIRHIPDSTSASITTDTVSVMPQENNILFADVDNAFGLDIVAFEGNQLKIWYHQDSLKYELKEWTLTDIAIETLQIADLTHNGKKEMLIKGTLAGEDRIIVLQSNDEDWNIQSIDLDAELVTIVPFEEVGTPKIISFGNDSIFIHSFNREKQVVLDKKLPFLGNVGTTHWGDLNGNTQPDLVLTAEETDGLAEVFLYLDLKTLEKLDTLSSDHLFMSDLNSDGLTDIYSERDSTMHYFLQTDSAQFEKVSIDSLASQHIAFGDYDTDGDLDIAAFDLVNDSLAIYSNTSGINEPPLPPEFVIVFQGNNAIALYWPEASDDLSKTLTYDLEISSADTTQDYKAAFFNADNGFRRGVRHGNMGTQRFGEFIDFPTGEFSVKIQSVDNSYYGSNQLCEGGGIKCDVIASEDITVCKDEFVSFTNTQGEISHWYSYNRGYLGLTDTLQYFAVENDILYTVSENATACTDYKYWNIFVEDLANISVLEDLAGCEGEPVTIDITNSNIPFDSIQWSINNSGGTIALFPGTDSIIQKFNLLLTENTQIMIDGYAGSCNILDTAEYSISKPIVNIIPDFAEILSGESVFINGTGGYNYLWSPSDGLDDPEIHNPVATPDESVTYFASITDSLGCSIRDSVVIDVNQVGFAAELFTPNNDGRNDRFTIHELNGGNNFRFKITDKRGNVVFNTQSIAEIKRGWDGTNGGTDLPSGSYLWEVTGTFEGKPILINGVQKGIINLIR